MRWYALALTLLLGCDVRALPQGVPTFEGEVGAVLSDSCGSCHRGESAEGGYRVETYLESIACLPDGASPVEPASEDARILGALGDAAHAGILDADAIALIEAWVLAGAPLSRGRAHPVGFADPRSEGSHARTLRAEAWERVLDPMVEGACGTCHAGAPMRLEGAGRAPGAPDCTSCHQEPEGVLTCGTCHGTRDHAHPPRDPCFHPEEEAFAGAHEAHAGLDCATCHGARDLGSLTLGGHGNSFVVLDFDPTVAGSSASFGLATRSCTNDCHLRDGERAAPMWSPDELAFDCNGCHLSPPADHFEGRCSDCHREANEDGTALTPGPLHVNGMVDLGDGSGTCGACHGAGDDPTPLTGSHAAHGSPSLTSPIGCEECHTVPSTPLDPGHFDPDPGAEVVFGDRAAARGATPTHEVDGSCRTVACHGAGLDGGLHPTPRWGAVDGLAASCGACHGVPPPAPHIASETCASLICHGSEIAYSPLGPVISETGRSSHINGVVEP